MVCSKCKKEVPDGIKYCVYCGTKLLKKCPHCRRTIPAESLRCPSCKVNISEYEKIEELINRGMELEKQWQYEKAKESYEEVERVYPTTFTFDTIRGRMNDLIDGCDEKIKIIKENIQKGERMLKRRRLKVARRAFEKVLEVHPEHSEAIISLDTVEKSIQARHRKVSIISGICIICIILGISFVYFNSLPYLAKTNLRALLKSSDRDIRYSAALILGWKGDRSSTEVLNKMILSSDEKTGVYALSALLRLGDAEVIDLLKEVMDKGSVPAKIAFGYCLADIGDTTVITDLLFYLKSEPWDVKLACSVILLNLGHEDGIPFIMRSIKSKNADIRFKSLYALYLLAEEETKKRFIFKEQKELMRLLTDKDKMVRALSAFLLLQSDAPISEGDSLILAKALWYGFMFAKRDVKERLIAEELRRRTSRIESYSIARGIIWRCGDEELVDSPVSEIKTKCIKTLARIELKEVSSQEEDIMEELREKLEQEDENEKLYAAITLYKCGDRTSYSVLKELLRSESEIVRINTSKLILE